MSTRWGFFRSALALSPLLVGFPLLSNWKHYDLPKPIADVIDNVTNVPQVSEYAILEHARYLSEDVGYRTVGTREHALGDAWMVQQAYALQTLCEEAVSAEPGRKLECEVWHQVGSGSHRFDILGKRLYKTYVNLTNIVVRISDGTPAGKKHAALANSHLDSTLPSPGAADDAIAVGALIEAARTLIATRGWEPHHALILLFNNAEESLQDGSHLFATAHPIRNTVRAVINLEAAGTSGPSLLFQATSSAMVAAYAQVPRPFGTIVAHDVFSSGIIMSDTDFRQFELYLGVPGLDIAIVGHGYFYHTRKDRVQYIEAGVAQHMGETAYALLKFLASKESPLLELSGGHEKPQTVFFSFLGAFFIKYSFATAISLHAVLFAASIALISSTPTSVSASVAVLEKKGAENIRRKVPEVSAPSNIGISIFKGILLLSTACLAAVLSANMVALFMVHVLDRPLSWYKAELSCLLLYGPPAFTGALASLNFLGPLFFPTSTNNISNTERTLLQSVLLSYIVIASVVQLAGIGSAVLLTMTAGALLTGLLFDRARGGNRVSLGTYALGQTTPLFFGTELFSTLTDIFVPLSGRMGAEAPAENLVASLTVFSAAYSAPLLLPFFARFGSVILKRALLILTLVTAATITIFSQRDPFDVMHPKRVFVVYNENITTNAVSLGVGTSDIAPGFNTFVQDIAVFLANTSRVGNTGATLKVNTTPMRVEMHEYNGDWDVLYPFSAFLSPYEIALEPYVSAYALGGDPEKTFTVRAINDVVDAAAATRSLTLIIDHPGLIWTTIAFDAHVLSWSLDDDPPTKHARHFVKEASFYGEDKWSIDLVISLHDLPSSSPSSPENMKDPEELVRPHALRVNFVGVQEAAMWPGKAADKAKGGRAMALLEELDAWLEERSQGAVDAMLLGCVGGVIDV
ncbi:hypothetical protein EW145_g6351 [Phellinidium pouzarii]|uniref:Peptide hydrolase n=1 Tax=Phellinidium pouzarii TaxID=167371 RepID=A0A4S4KWU9_9AGAM|nr:hypothetical protein EW145_g6351 [Phellinidium pouzarii]